MGSDRNNTEAALELLWHGLSQPRRGPRHGLTVQRVVDAALAVAEQGGVPALSMRGVAAELGVGTATLYTYIPDKAALLALMSDTMVAELPLPHTRAGGWREQTEAWAREELAGFRAYPWLVEVDDTRVVGPHAFAWMDSAIRVFDGTGLSPQEALTVVEAVTGLVRGHVAMVIAEDQVRNWTEAEGQHPDSVQDAFLATRGPEPGSFPALESAGAPPTAEGTFEAGLALLLDGVEMKIRGSKRS